MNAQIIAVANQKGGVAKTTVSHNVACALAQRGKKTLIMLFDCLDSAVFSGLFHFGLPVM